MKQLTWIRFLAYDEMRCEWLHRCRWQFTLVATLTNNFVTNIIKTVAVLGRTAQKPNPSWLISGHSGWFSSKNSNASSIVFNAEMYSDKLWHTPLLIRSLCRLCVWWNSITRDIEEMAFNVFCCKHFRWFYSFYMLMTRVIQCFILSRKYVYGHGLPVLSTQLDSTKIPINNIFNRSLRSRVTTVVLAIGSMISFKFVSLLVMRPMLFSKFLLFSAAKKL